MLAHLSDLHLGHGTSGGEGEAGGIRDADVRDAFLRAVRGVVRLRPDLVLLTGDLFEESHPPPGAVATLLHGLRTLSEELPGVPLLVLAGGRDTPPLPAGGPGPLGILDGVAGVRVATAAPRPVMLEDVGVHVWLVPHAALRGGLHPLLAPDPAARWNVLAMHALAGGGDDAPLVDPTRWDWVALGADHRSRTPLPGARWAGSLERVSQDPWREAGEEKGFVTVDLASRVVTLHPLPGRPLVEVAPIHRGRQGLPRVNARIRAAVEAVPGGIDGKLVRLRVHGLTPEDRLALDGAWISVVRRRTAHLQLQLRSGNDPPGLEGVDAVPDRRGLRAVVGGTARDRRTLLEDWRREGPDGLPAPPSPGDLASPVDEELIWGGSGPEDPELFLERAVAALAALRPAALPDPDSGSLPGAGDGARAPAMVGISGASRGSGPAAETPPVEGLVPYRSVLPADEARVLALRADAVEVDGEVEALTVEWLRERQDAETQLQSHRDRARDLRDRIRAMEAAGTQGPCPVCGRPLADHLEEVLGSFREEWEALVQDGTWWRRRREQLEPKPELLRELEIRGMRLHAELEAVAEETDRARSQVDLPEGAGEGGASSPEGLESGTVSREAGHPSLRESLLARTSDLLNRLTDGLVAGVVERGERLMLVVDGRALPLVATPDRAAVRLALHLALVERALEEGATPSPLRLGAAVAALDPGDATRLVELLRRLSRYLPGVLVDTGAELLRRRVDRFDGIVELRPGTDAAGRPLLKLHPGGRVRIRLGTDTPG